MKEMYINIKLNEFDSLQLEANQLIYDLLYTDKENINDLLGITPEMYHNKQLATQWRNSIINKLSYCNIELILYRVKAEIKIDEIYNNMIKEDLIMKNKNEIQEVKSLRWLANMFPFVENAEDESDRISNCINIYSTAAADKLEEVIEINNKLMEKNNTRKYNVITLCGSTKFKDKFMEVQKELTLAGNIVLNLAIFSHTDDEKLTEHQIVMLADMHKQKIDMCDKIVVINVGGYIGTSAKTEIEYAKSKGKEIIYLEE